MGCIIDNCDRELKGRKFYCEAHYYRKRRNGTFNLNKKVQPYVKLGLSNTVEYKTWHRMHRRCVNEKDKVYKYYGGRGIKVCKRWSKFVNFLNDMGIRPSKKHSLERINNNLGYTPANCVWSLSCNQARNRRGILMTQEKAIEVKNLYFRSELTQKEIGLIYGVHESTISNIIIGKTWA